MRALALVLLSITTEFSIHGDACDICEWGPWSDWTECSRTCGGGLRNKTRGICCRTDQTLESCLLDCNLDLSSALASSSVVESCNEECYSQGGGSYVKLTPVSGYCECSNPYEGSCCETEKPRKGLPEGTDSCDDVCNWSTWGAWSTCSVSCGGGGQQQRQRNLCCLEEYGDFQNCADTCGKDINDHVENRSCGDTCLYGGSMKVDGFGCQCLDRSFGHCCEELLPSCTPFPTDVIFVLDSSVSQTAEQFEKQLDFVLQFINHVNISEEEFQISIVTFSFEAKVEVNFNQSTDKESLRDLINKIAFRPGATYTNKGLNAALEVARQSERRKGMVTLTYAFLLTDGMSTKRQDTKIAAKALRNANVHVIAIGIGKEVSHKELTDIASPGDQYSPSYVFSVGDFNALDTLLKQLVHITCDDCSSLSHFSNIMFLVDESNGMTEEEFEKSVDVMTTMVTNTDYIGEVQGHSFGLVQLGNELNNVINISSHLSQSELILHLRVITRQTHFAACMKDEQCSKINITTAINETLQSYNKSSGRENARKFLIILSNGRYEEPSEIQNEMARILEHVDVKVFVIGLGPEIDMDGLLSLAKEANHVFVAQDDSDYSNFNVMKSEFTYNVCIKD